MGALTRARGVPLRPPVPPAARLPAAVRARTRVMAEGVVVCLTLLPYLGYTLHPNLPVFLLLLSGAGAAYRLGLDH
ncbi:hypothetical protein [Streptomyces sp. JNUCC 63]